MHIERPVCDPLKILSHSDILDEEEQKGENSKWPKTGNVPSTLLSYMARDES